MFFDFLALSVQIWSSHPQIYQRRIQKARGMISNMNFIPVNNSNESLLLELCKELEPTPIAEYLEPVPIRHSSTDKVVHFSNNLSNSNGLFGAVNELSSLSFFQDDVPTSLDSIMMKYSAMNSEDHCMPQSSNNFCEASTAIITVNQSGRWHERFEDLCRFKEEHGHCCVPSQWNNRPLAQWVKRQRYQRKIRKEGQHSTMTDEREQALDALGFVSITWLISMITVEVHTLTLCLLTNRYGILILPSGKNVWTSWWNSETCTDTVTFRLSILIILNSRCGVSAKGVNSSCFVQKAQRDQTWLWNVSKNWLELGLSSTLGRQRRKLSWHSSFLRRNKDYSSVQILKSLRCTTLYVET